MLAKMLADSTDVDVTLLAGVWMPQFVTAGVCYWLGLIFNPENTAKLSDCGISILDSPTDIMKMVLPYLGLDGDSKNPEDFSRVVEALAPIRQPIRTFDKTNYLNVIPNGELCAINNGPGDYGGAVARAAEAGIEMNLIQVVPRTGAPRRFNVWAIPTDAPNPDNAYAYIDYLLQPEMITGCTNYTLYAYVNDAADAFVDPAIIAGGLSVFIPAAGELIIPSLVGSAGRPMIGRMILDEFGSARDWPMASTMAVALLMLIVVPLMAYTYFETQTKEPGT